MKISNLLHFYQPYNQQDDILRRIVDESYLPIIRGMLERPQSKAIVNINGGLTGLLQEGGYLEVLEGMKTLVERGQIEFTGSAMYHAFLPLLPKEEIIRQVKLNTEENQRYFGDLYNPIGFFPPELAVSPKILETVSEMGFKWIAAPQVSYGSKEVVPDKLFADEKSGITIMFRNKRVSSLILSAVARDAETLVKETQDIIDLHKYWFTVMDAETFGHHRIGHERLLFDIFDSPHFESVAAKEIMSLNLVKEHVNLRPSTWTNEEQDFWLDREQTKQTEAKSFILWKDPSNPIHNLQWEFVDFVLAEVNNYPDKEAPSWLDARNLLDKALASDQFWWASTKPWWSLEMIEQGAHMLKDVIRTLEGEESFSNTVAASEADPSFEASHPSEAPERSKAAARAEEYYRKILDQAFEWQRTGYIRKRHLDNSATFMKDPFKDRAPKEWYNQIVLEFEAEMKKAAENQEFEKAVKWRDALIKMKQGTDIYDVLHVVDELWTARNIPGVKPFLEHGWGEISDFAKGYLQDAATAEEFENWKKHEAEKTPPDSTEADPTAAAK